MSKYHFHRMSSNAFQEMVQSLLEVRRRGRGELVQFASAGADGSREATWMQPVNHPDYVRPSNETTDVPKQHIFQVKFHDIGLRGWSGAGAAVVSDLKAELEKVITKHQLRCHTYVLITNVPLTGASRIGTRDKITKIAAEWQSKIPSIEVWDAADLSRMLDNNPAVRSTYTDLILPGDVLAALLNQHNFHADRRQHTFRGYLRSLVDGESKARAEEAGDDDPLPLTKVFIDQTLQLDKDAVPQCYRETVDAWSPESILDEDPAAILPDDLDQVSSAFPLLWGALGKVMLLAGPGYGKSTITQFLAIYHAARLVDRTFAAALAKRLKLPAKWTPNDLDASCTLRFPFRVELRRYAKWRKTLLDDRTPAGIASYIARQIIGGSVESSLTQDDVFALISSNPTLLILDGLDEIPNKDDRDALLKDCDSFLNRCDGENVDLQIVMSSRPQGYHGEFDRFQPLRWRINDLSIDDFNQYAADWLTERIRNSDERREAEERIKRGMASEAVRRLATTLLQATVMLTIVRKKSDIPEERHKLFQKYVDVVFQREKTKNDVISRYEPELRLLHEMVGYQIHEAVSRGEAATMPEGKFKEAVWTVWRLIRGEERINSIPNEEIKSIYDLATDRLIFLSGKGATQSDIDFVIQPYREYFAASYMSNHANVNSDKVFKSLVARGPYWQQVLRFFVAMAAPAQRLVWAFDAATDTDGPPDNETLVATLPAKRAVVFALPEFERLLFDHFRRIFNACFRERDWWTWLGQEWICPILETFRDGDAWRELWKMFQNKSERSLGNNQFAIWLFSRVIPREAAEYSSFVEFISTALQDEALATGAIDVALFGELDVDLGLVDPDVLAAVIAQLPYKRYRSIVNGEDYIRKHLPPTKFLSLACTIRNVYFSLDDIWEVLELPVEAEYPHRFDFEEIGGAMISVVRPSWLTFNIECQQRLPFPTPDSSNGEYVRYFRLLFESLIQPDDPDLYRTAKDAMCTLPRSVNWRFTCDFILGPPPDQFRSVEDWRRYKSDVRYLFDTPNELLNLREVAASFSSREGKCQEKWIVLLFPISQWDRLISAGLLRAEIADELRTSKWADCFARRKDWVVYAGVYRRYSPTAIATSKIPFVRIMQVAIGLHNEGILVDSELAADVMGSADTGAISSEEIHSLIKAIRNPSAFPESWTAVLFSVALRVNNVNLHKVSDLWAATVHARNNEMRLRLYELVTAQLAASLIEELLDLRNDAALDLAIQVSIRNHALPSELSSELNRRICSRLHGHGYPECRLDAMLSCLFVTHPTMEEARVYSDVATMSKIRAARPHVNEEITNRLTIMPQALGKEMISSLRVELLKILARDEDYWPTMRAAALDSLIQLDILNCSPLSEADWQFA
ncbi:MAG: hypothetical protein JSS49_26320 [Planctomycetes bacterium]|nr:hypothetical protein [Planctomycetota bacterium]